MSDRSGSQTQFTLERNGTVLSESELAESLNQHFTSVACDVPPLDTTCLPQFLPSAEKVHALHSYEVCQKLLKLQANKAMGPDKIPPRIIKLFAYELAEHVMQIFNTPLSSGEVPAI